MKAINIFYEEPNPDRWLKYDRYPRKWIRRIIRGKPIPGGQMMVALNLLKGLKKLNISYRFNDYAYAAANPNELVGVIGKPHLIFQNKLKNPILFGASVFSHPIEHPNLLSEYPNIKKILVPGPWIKDKFDTYYGKQNVVAWPVGIDTQIWNPSIKDPSPKYDFLIYDKIRWKHELFENTLLTPIQELLTKNKLSFDTIRYGSYKPADLIDKVRNCKAAIFLCEHETQGIAYQQILATGTPILAWDRGGYWQDPEYFPHRVKYQPVSAVPYWDHRCGEKFENINEFNDKLDTLITNFKKYNPAEFISQKLTLEKCALAYVKIYNELTQQ